MDLAFLTEDPCPRALLGGDLQPPADNTLLLDFTLKTVHREQD